MKRAAVTALVAIVGLLLIGALSWAGCGGEKSSAADTTLSGSEPWVAAFRLVHQKEGDMTASGAVVQVRGGVLTFEVEASDPRVSGTAEITVNVDQQRPELSGTLWGSCVLTNDRGTWVCDSWTGAASNGYKDQYTFSVMKGTGEYEGLVLYSQWHFQYVNYTMKMEPSEEAAASGWIDKAL